MSYATMQDISFALDLIDRELPGDRPRHQPDELRAAEPELPKQRGEACATKRESKRKPARKRAA